MEHDFAAAGATAENALKGIKAILTASADHKVVRAAAEVEADLLELKSRLLAAQTKMQQLAGRAGELEAKVKGYEDWDAVKKNYEAVELIRGLIVYSLKSDANTGEPHHYVCPRCYERRKKRFLLRPRVTSSTYSCQECRFELLLTRPERNSMARALGGSWTGAF